MLLDVAVTWIAPRDETAYWNAAVRLLQGQPLYDPSAPANQPFVYWYPPVLAQLLAPITLVLPYPWFVGFWTVGLVACLWWLSDGRLLVSLALVAFPPVAAELLTRNVHLLLAVLLVAAVRQSSRWWIAGAALKVSPALGIASIALHRRYREALCLVGLGLVVLALSIAVSPSAWRQFLDVIRERGSASGGDGLLPVPYAFRAVAGVVLVVVGAHLGTRANLTLLVTGVTVANPTLWANAFSLLIALYPLVIRPTLWPATRQSTDAPALELEGANTAAV